MPQDKRRSSRYRSFVTCDNPKGVVECGTIRKSKIKQQHQQQQHNFKVIVEGDKKQGNNPSTTTTSLGVIKEGKKEMCIHEITREEEELPVSKSEAKMNNVINSWSKKRGDEEDIAKDLIKGALDLQESLFMLGKFQEEASSLVMSKSSRKQKCKVEEGRFDGMVNGLNNNVLRPNKGRVVQDEKLQIGFEKPRKSTDEMKKVVRESLLRQNVITNPIFEQHFDHKMLLLGCSDHMPSTSSSQSSSMVRSSTFVPSDSSSSTTVSQRRKKKESNLIVRLMGLESPPLSPKWREEGEKIVNLSKPRYGVDSPRARKCQYGAQMLGKKQRTVEEILKTLHFKGLLRSRSGSWMSPDSVESDVFTLKNDERPPIVIMKPLCYSSRDVVEVTAPSSWREGGMKPACNRRSVGENISNTGANFSDRYRVAGVGYEEDCKSLLKAGFVKAFVNLDRKIQTKQEAPRKSVEKASPSKRKDAKFRDELRFNDQEKSSTSKSIKPKDGRSNSKHHISRQQNATSTSIEKQEICEISGQRKKNRRPALAEENKKCKGKVKEREVACIDDIAVTRGNSLIFDTLLEQNRSKACRNQSRDHDVQAIEYCRNHEASVCDIPLADADEQCNGYNDSNSCYSEITSVSTSEHCTVGPLDEDQNPVCEVTLVTTHENGVAVHDLGDKPPPFPCENGAESSKERHQWTSTDGLSTRLQLQTLLFSNPFFLRHLEELCDLQIYPDTVPYATDKTATDPGWAKLVTDYANEVMQLKITELSQAYLPQTWMYTKKSRNLITLDQLLDEISNGIEGLKCYHSSASDEVHFSSDNLYLILDRDLSFKGGTWDIGWRRMFSKHELDRVISDVDKLILGKLIEEVLFDFMAT